MDLSNSIIEKISYISGNGNPNKYSYIFSKESCSYILENGNPKKFFIFRETELFHISGNGNLKKLFIFHEVTFRPRKVKRTHS